MKIKKISDNKEKQSICRDILSDLPEWFGIESALNAYVEAVKSYPMFVAMHQAKAIGFYSVKEENSKTLDMYVLGVKKAYHRSGVGHALQKAVNTYAKENGYTYLIVLTLADTHPDKHYQITRAFYRNEGFAELYQSNKIWNKDNPTQIFLKPL